MKFDSNLIQKAIKDNFGITLNIISTIDKITEEPQNIIIENEFSQVIDKCKIYKDEFDIVIEYQPICVAIFNDPFKDRDYNTKTQQGITNLISKYKEWKKFRLPIAHIEELQLQDV